MNRDARYHHFLAMVVLLFLPGCAAGIARQDVLNRMQERLPLLVVDVRSQGEYDRGHVPGAVHVPFYSIRAGLKSLAVSPRDPVVLYCEHGPRAGIAGFLLRVSGYQQVYSLEGHMKGWRRSEFPIETIAH